MSFVLLTELHLAVHIPLYGENGMSTTNVNLGKCNVTVDSISRDRIIRVPNYAERRKNKRLCYFETLTV